MNSIASSESRKSAALLTSLFEDLCTPTVTVSVGEVGIVVSEEGFCTSGAMGTAEASWSPVVIEGGKGKSETVAEHIVSAAKQYDYKSVGQKYDPKLSVTEIAARIRAEIKAAQKGGELPRSMKVSVRKRSCTHSWAIDVSATNIGCELYTDDYKRAQAEHRDFPWHQRFTAEADRILSKLQAIWSAFNFDDSDSMTDYFHVNYYGGVKID